MMRRTIVWVGLVGVLAASAGIAAPALAAGQSPAVTDCNAHGRLTHPYTAKQLQTALSTMPADIKEYTDCYDVIQRALLAKVGAQHKSGSGGAVSGSSGSSGSGGSFLPTPVIIVIVVLVLAAATFGALALRRRAGGGGAEGP